MALSRRLHFRCRSRHEPFFFNCTCCAILLRWPNALRCIVSYKSVNFPQPFAVFKMAEYHETFITSLAARPGSAPILAIIERIRSGVFAFSFGFVGFNSKFARGLISAFWHCYRFERKRYLFEFSHMCVLISTRLTYPLRKDVNWKKQKKKSKVKTSKRQQKVDAARARTLVHTFGLERNGYIHRSKYE